MAEAIATESRSCMSCGTGIAGVMLACPVCATLVHSEELKQLSARAREEETSGDLDGAISTFTRMVSLLPANTRQAAAVLAERDRLMLRKGTTATKTPLPAWAKRLGPIGVALAFILGKGKLLLLGLTKLSTVVTMLASFGLYAKLWGVWFAGGLILSIYIHEMGHVSALRAAGLPASAPMFIPGFGAMVRLHVRPPDGITDARIGLAGPIWGLGAAALSLALGHIYSATPALLAIGAAGARINLFNLIPVWQLDGSRGLQALDRTQRICLVALTLALSLWHSEGMLLLIALGLGFRLFDKQAPRPGTGDWATFATFAGTMTALALCTTIHVPT